MFRRSGKIEVTSPVILGILTICTLEHGGTWRTMHCRLCIKCYGTGQWGGGRCALPQPLHTHKRLVERRQCIVLQIPPWDRGNGGCKHDIKKTSRCEDKSWEYRYKYVKNTPLQLYLHFALCTKMSNRLKRISYAKHVFDSKSPMMQGYPNRTF